jgi:hypothetical protein
MHIPPPIALLAWIPIGSILFFRYPVRKAILVNFLAGWALLPSANYVPTPDWFPFWILPVSLPSEYLLTKGTVIGLAALLGVVLFRRRALAGFRPKMSDVPVAVWCIVPLFSATLNHLGLLEGAAGALYLFLTWGVPFLLGRHFFSDRDSLTQAALAVAIAGILYTPICFFEFFKGPQFYAHVYGYEPFRWIGARRYLGFRPIGFMEDGNQLGMWMATSSLAATALWARRLATRICGLPVKWAAALLVGVAFLCQSIGSILLLVLLLPIAFSSQRSIRRGIAVFLIVLALGVALELSHVVPWRELYDSNPTVHSIGLRLRHIGRGSFGWRLGRDEAQARIALRTPILGSGRWDWWLDGGVRPWDLWLLSFGMYGLVGLAALVWMMTASIVRPIWFAPTSASQQFSWLLTALAAIVLINALDALLNGAFLLPYVLLIGGLSSRIVPDPAPDHAFAGMAAGANGEETPHIAA